MATLTASHLVSRSSNVDFHGASETKADLAQIAQRNQTMTHSGLRSLNKLDVLRMRTRANTVARQAMKNTKKTENEGPLGKIVCGEGMNLIFVGAEVGPWSKTGGLGDVLGGLPPAMAVSGTVIQLLI